MRTRITQVEFFYFDGFHDLLLSGLYTDGSSPVGPSFLLAVGRMAAALRGCSLKESHHFSLPFLFPNILLLLWVHIVLVPMSLRTLSGL